MMVVFKGTANDLSLLTREYVLARVSEEDIMEFYLGIPVRLYREYRNPLRKDERPSCRFSYWKGRLKFTDWAWGKSFDCFDVVCAKFNCDYATALKIISKDFQVIGRAINASLSLERERREREARGRGERTVIQVRTQDFTPIDARYLNSFGLNRAVCELYNVYSVAQVWIGGRSANVYVPGNPMLGYYFGKGEISELWKIYFYLRKKEDGRRFLCNTQAVAGFVQLPEEGEMVVLTKSLKDVMVLHRIGIPALAMQSETMEPYPELVDELRSRFSILLSLYDFDYPGVRMAHRLRSLYGVQPFFLTNGRFRTRDYGAKDISDYVREKGLESATKLVQWALSLRGLSTSSK